MGICLVDLAGMFKCHLLVRRLVVDDPVLQADQQGQVEELENKLPNAPGPFTEERHKLKEERDKRKEERGKPKEERAKLKEERDNLEEGTFSITRNEAVIPFLVCLVFLLLAGRPLLEWLARSNSTSCSPIIFGP
jgi:hypothetical protein